MASPSDAYRTARPTPHHLRRLLRREPGHEAKDDGLLLVWRQVGDRPAQLTDLLAAEADRLHPIAVRQIMVRGELFRRSLATNVVDHRIPRDAEDPGGKGTATRAIARQ